jgi:signal transduction histidine kinase
MKNPPRSFAVFHTIRSKLMALMILLSLLPLAGMAAISWFAGREQIQNQVRDSLRKMAQDAADKIDMILRGKREELHSMAVSYSLLSRHKMPGDADGLTALLNEYFFNHEGYVAIVVTDASGKIMGVNTVDRSSTEFPRDRVAKIAGADISAWPREHKMFLESARGLNSHTNWYRSELARDLCGENGESENTWFNIALSEPLRDPVTNNVIGVWINIIDGSYLQNVLYNTETDLDAMSLGTGRGFLAYDDGGGIIRRGGGSDGSDDYDLRPIGDSNKLHDAILAGAMVCDYTAADGGGKMAGLARVSDRSFGWVVGLEIDEEDLLLSIRTLTRWLFGVCAFLGIAMVACTWLIARGITRPLNTLTLSAQRIAQGDFGERLDIRSSDELGFLASAFNEMSRALASREAQIQEMTRNLEDKVRERTRELENSNEALKRAYLDLQNAHEQLVHTEKMASLGQLVAGIAHEIKNPLNFIYGNTDFLREYTLKTQELIEKIEALPSISPDDRQRIAKEKEAIQYDFIRDDFRMLISDLTEGTERINAIVKDLRIFSRMDTAVTTEIDVHAMIDMSLNLLRNQYKDRVEVHKDYGVIPKIRGYAGKLNQVFMNLLSNAIYAVAENGDVWIRTRALDEAVEIEIEDSGVGIPKENLKRIFEPFFTTKPVGQGTGLGLSISYGVIEQHHGKIRVLSVPGKGTVFTVRLPADPEKAG